VDLVDLPLPLLKLLLRNVIHPSQQWVVYGFLREETAGSQEKYKREYEFIWSHDSITYSGLQN